MNTPVRISKANHTFIVLHGDIPDVLYLGVSEYLDLCVIMEKVKVETYLGLKVVQVMDRYHLNVVEMIEE